MAAFVKQVVLDFLTGAFDSVSFHKAWTYLNKSAAIRERTARATLLNGGVFLGSMVFESALIRPLGQQIVQLFRADETAFRVFFNFLFGALWLWPVYFLCVFLCMFWYADIASAAFVLMHGRAPSTSLGDIKRTIVDSVRKMIITVIATLAVVILAALPLGLPGYLVTFALNSWLYAFLVADLAWSASNAPLEQRIGRIEANWAYYLGFGGYLSALSLRLPFHLYSGIIAMLQPVLLLLLSAASPEPRPGVPALPVFGLVRRASAAAEGAFVRWYMGRGATRKRSSSVS